jgi:hypothetical protein
MVVDMSVAIQAIDQPSEQIQVALEHEASL